MKNMLLIYGCGITTSFIWAFWQIPVFGVIGFISLILMYVLHWLYIMDTYPIKEKDNNDDKSA